MVDLTWRDVMREVPCHSRNQLNRLLEKERVRPARIIGIMRLFDPSVVELLRESLAREKMGSREPVLELHHSPQPPTPAHKPTNGKEGAP